MFNVLNEKPINVLKYQLFVEMVYILREDRTLLEITPNIWKQLDNN